MLWEAIIEYSIFYPGKKYLDYYLWSLKWEKIFALILSNKLFSTCMLYSRIGSSRSIWNALYLLVWIFRGYKFYGGLIQASQGVSLWIVSIRFRENKYFIAYLWFRFTFGEGSLVFWRYSDFEVDWFWRNNLGGLGVSLRVKIMDFYSKNVWGICVISSYKLSLNSEYFFQTVLLCVDNVNKWICWGVILNW